MHSYATRYNVDLYRSLKEKGAEVHELIRHADELVQAERSKELQEAKAECVAAGRERRDRRIDRDRAAAGIPTSAAFFTFAYPMAATRDHFESLLAHAHNSRWVFFTSSGISCARSGAMPAANAGPNAVDR